jgi:DNA-binding protein
MDKEQASKVIVIKPSDISLKVSDFAERIISGIMESGELDVIGISDAMFLACSAVNMATEIANVFVDEICIDTIEVPLLGKIGAVYAHLSQSRTCDSAKLALEEERTMPDLPEQTISIGRDLKMEKLLTICLLKLTRFDRLKLMAAGGAINDAIILALKLTTGRISKEPLEVKLIQMYSINTRADESKKISAMSIYLKKGVNTQYSKRYADLLKKLKGGF